MRSRTLNVLLLTTLPVAVLVLATPYARAQSDLPDDAALIRVLDVGQGLSVVAALPGGYYVVFDAGDGAPGNPVLNGVREVIPPGEQIDLLVLSHPDADHINDAQSLLDAFTVRRIVRTGFRGDHPSMLWKNLDSTITARAHAGEFIDLNLQRCELPPGSTYRYGDAFVTFLAGVSEPPDDWGLGGGEGKNAVSIAMRLSYRGGSVLFTGDAFGRRDGTPDSRETSEAMMESAAATERGMLDFADVLPLASDVLIAPHHGADDGSSAAFIGAVDPRWVVFSAGTNANYRHPRQTTADRYIAAGVAPWRILRTDADEAPEAGEWSRDDWPPVPGAGGDIDISITERGHVFVRYRGAVRD